MNEIVAPLPIAVLISGGGTTLKNLLTKIDAEDLPVEIKLVVSSSAKARGLIYAKEIDIPTLVVRERDYETTEAFGNAIFATLRDSCVELVVMAGFLKFLPIPEDFENRVVNIHPGLIPAFCGQGFYGLRVHQAVIDYGVKISGCTVHFVDNQYDHGPIILQRVVEVRDDDTAESLQQRIFKQECEAYPDAIRLFAEGRLNVVDRRVTCRNK